MCLQNSSSKNFNLSENFNWKFFAELVQKHKVADPVNKSLKALIPEVPASITKFIKNQVRRTGMENLKQTKILIDLTGEFDKHELKVLFVKGMITGSLYPDIKYQRPAKDIDILVAWPDVKKIISILDKAKFKQLQKSYTRSTGSIDFTHQGSGVMLELHWNLWSKREEVPTNFTSLWQEREYVNIHKIKIPTINHLTHISYLCYHGAVHFWYRLFWLLDIHYLLQNPKINWDLVVANAKTNGTLPALYLAAILSRDFFYTNIPEVLDTSTSSIQNMRQEIWQVIKNNPHGLEFSPKTFKDKLRRVNWKIKLKSKYKLRTIFKLALIR